MKSNLENMSKNAGDSYRMAENYPDNLERSSWKWYVVYRSLEENKIKIKNDNIQVISLLLLFNLLFKK